MFRPTCLLALGALPLFGNVATTQVTGSLSKCADVIPHEPLLVYEVTGGTLIGPYDRELVVYTDGSARFSSAVAPEGTFCERADVGPEAVSALALELESYGAFAFCDAQGFVTDVPLQTLTIRKPGTDSLSHVASWWIPDVEHQKVQQRLERFIAKTFPGH